jgi:hypothetical protein
MKPASLLVLIGLAARAAAPDLEGAVNLEIGEDSSVSELAGPGPDELEEGALIGGALGAQQVLPGLLN